MMDDDLAWVEHVSMLEMQVGRVPRVLIWEWLSKSHPDWSNDQVFARERIARPVLISTADTMQ